VTQVERDLVVHLHCRECDVHARAIRLAGSTEDHQEWRFRGRRCSHAEQQETAAMRALVNPSGRSYARPVTASCVGIA